jgi:FKBP-type peptidyl-prolyl cis-trans isomerase SlyD
MIAEKDNVVSVVYELREGSKNGEVVEALTPDHPLTFLFGSGGLLPKFEENLNGLSTGDSFEFLLNSEDAYGPVVENAIVHVPLQIFEVEGRIDESLLKVGTTVPMMDSEGRRLNGKVLGLEGEAVKMDFNHPMAGRDLHFSGTVTEVRNATEEELTHGHVHSNGSHDCGSCGDEGGHSCNCGH